MHCQLSVISKGVVNCGFEYNLSYEGEGVNVQFEVGLQLQNLSIFDPQ